MTTRDGSISKLWGDGDHRFCLPIGQLIELEEKCDAGLPEIFTRVAIRKWRSKDLREIIRLGLIGGGMAPADSELLVRRYFDPPERPKIEAVEIAVEILSMALQGPPDEPLGKEGPAGENATTTAPGSNGGSSTGQPQQSDSDRTPSTGGVSGNTLQ